MTRKKICVDAEIVRKLEQYASMGESWDSLLTKLLDHIEACSDIWCDLDEEIHPKS